MGQAGLKVFQKNKYQENTGQKFFQKRFGSKVLQGFASCAWEGFAFPPKLPPVSDTPFFRTGCELIGLKA